MTFEVPVHHAPPGFEGSPGPEARPLCFREVPWQWSDLAIGLAPLLVQRLLPYIAGPVDAGWQPFLMVFWIPLSLLPFAWMAAYPLWIARRRGFRPVLPGTLGSNALESGIALIVFPVVLILIGVVQAATSFVFGEVAQPGSTLEPIYRSSNFNAMVMTILAVSIGPVAEEIFFRGMLYNTLRTRIPVVLAVLIQAVIFAGMHPFDLAAIESIAVLGIAMGLLYEWRKTLISPIAYHAIQNLAASIVMISSAAAYAEGPMLGVGGAPVENRCQVGSVAAGSAAEAAGLRAGDVITTVDHQPITNQKQLIDLIGARKAGDQVSIEFERNGEKHQVKTTLKRRREP